MSQAGIDFFTSDADEGIFRLCSICGSPCSITRDVDGPRSLMQGLAGRHSRHDRHQCPHSEKGWHTEVWRVLSLVERCPTSAARRSLREHAHRLLLDGLADASVDGGRPVPASPDREPGAAP